MGGKIIDTEVLVNGGGVGGLALAVKLASRGVQVTVVEQLKAESPQYKGELLQPKTLAILEDLEIIDRVLANGHSFSSLEFIELERQISEPPRKVGESCMDYESLATPYNYALMIPHETLKAILLDKLKQYEGSFRYIQPARFTGFKDGKALIRHTKDQSIEPIHARFYIGAEGRNSPTRNAMGLKANNRTYNHHFLTVTIPRPADFTTGKIVTTNHRFLGLFPLPDNKIRTVFLIKAGTYKSMKEEGIEYFHRAYEELCPELGEHVASLESWKDIQLMIPTMYHVNRYVVENLALIGDAAHAVHPMAGEGMNLAIQDADVLGELIAWMKRKGHFDNRLLKWYEEVRMPRAKFLLGLSHLSALAYSFPYPWWRRIRIKSIEQMEQDPALHVKQMLNISGLGRWDNTVLDRLIQIGAFPKRKHTVSRSKQLQYFFERTEDYPWEKEE
ncbi:MULTISPECIES: FAD-dependent oxidoreductase [Pontibacillus]|uniref:FAD-dependent monooxygenase n=1 Tax=Pontibacillus chungwhensis TaxID=265426 RepID=A0ABY8UY76_9BACI|nr:MULTISPECIES: FAD-dependent monooxygenase [Pontibacillus]MCD5325498.1 FAD-dependent monooxygenase [Pontibacillus sp. HN14]WIF98610.1 FAD-dependent monooxygenase [Pontibacillus chungwhensis]